MTSTKTLLAGACALLGVSACVPPPAAHYRSPSVTASPARLLALHNAERARVGVPPLQWDPALAAAAASYAATLARSGRFQHSPRAGRPGQSENLWMGTRGAYSPEQMVGSWIAERRYFVPGVFPSVSRTGNWADVAHYTQMVWRGTTHVGCAIHGSASNDYLVCRYSPRGNIDGRRVY